MKHRHYGFFSAIFVATLCFGLPATTAFSADTTKPTVSFVNVKSGQRWSNDVFTVQGKAADKVGVTNVLYSLNNANWIQADTTNAWTNWSAEINLLPGTNTIAAYAVDSSGNRSATNTVRLVYYLTDVLTVLTNGTGKISLTPVYNGVRLQIGANYAITAKSSVANYGLVNWTDADGNFVANGATLKFTMASNLVFTANFGDTTKPTVSIANIKSGQRWSNDVFTVQGKAADNIGVTNVLYSVNHADWISADTTNVWANWSAEINLLPGTNSIAACAVDGQGNRSLTNTVQLVYYLTDVLTVLTNGSGKISLSPDYNGARLQIGANYTITAKSSIANYGLVNWTDADDHIVTNGAALKFMMASNLTFTANFGDVGRPTVRVISSSTNAAGDLNVLLFHGTATDNIGVSNVFYRIDNGVWQSASTANQWTNWTATVNLNPGSSTFYVYAVDTNLNASPTIPVNIFNVTTPNTLSGLQARVAIDGSDEFQLAFGKNTFSQIPSKANVEGGGAVGTYTYTKGSDGASAALNLKYTAPPSATSNGPQSIVAYFLDRNTAYFNFGSGYLYFSPAPNFARASVVNQFLVSAGSGVGAAYGTLFQNGIFTSYPLLTAGTNTGKYTYTTYSPMSALFKLTDTEGTDYIIATYGGTNYGGYYSAQYTPAGVTNGSDTGTFIFAAQTPGGNAPLSLTNREFNVFTGDGDFNVQFGPNTYSQDSTSTNYDNAVGDYTYSLANTNIGLLNLAVTAPPHLAGSGGDARLIFVASNAGVFTNDDGTISAFAMTSLTNSPLTNVAGTTLNITEDTGGVDTIQLANDGTFNYGDETVGQFDYQVYSPLGSMLLLSVTNTSFTVVTNTQESYITNFDDTIVTNLDYTYATNANYKPQSFWLQFKLTTAQGETNSGSTYVNIYETNSLPSDFFRGTYNLH
jgi:hypothetical protein